MKEHMPRMHPDMGPEAAIGLESKLEQVRRLWQEYAIAVTRLQEEGAYAWLQEFDDRFTTLEAAINEGEKPAQDLLERLEELEHDIAQAYGKILPDSTDFFDSAMERKNRP